MNKTMFRVTNTSGKVNEFFDNRESAIDFIVDEFAMTLIFRTENESKLLKEYMEEHNETPRRYPFSYTIEEIKINHDYDKPIKKSIYLVLVESLNCGVGSEQTKMFPTYEKAKEYFDEVVSKDLEKYDPDNTCKYARGENMYERDAIIEYGGGIGYFFATIERFVFDGDKYEEVDISD